MTEALILLQARVAELEQPGATAMAHDESAASAETLRPAAPDSVAATQAARAADTAPHGPAAAPADAPHAPLPPRGPSRFDRAWTMAREFFFSGNTVVRVGVLVLLVGVALLAKYAAENSLFPIEARLACFGISLQGGGVAALYLVVFFAFRVYMLVPVGMAFALFVAIALACGALAVLQSAQPLLVIGSLGGFLAPVLASTGAGNHVLLFSFYLLLNIGIAAVAGFKSWRLPPVLAFVCTYGVATAWGVLRYRPEDFASTEPFVLAFLVLFTAIAIMHAWRQPPRLRGPIDGALVFGTPLLSLVAQGRLVSEIELGLAYSAAGLGLFYAGLATWLWRSAPAKLRTLAEAFVALAVGFGTMAIPFAFEASLSVSVAWALEGAGLYWVGARQERTLARFSGVGLQVLAGISFIVSTLVHGGSQNADFLLLANGRFLSCLALALGGFFIARQAEVSRASIRPFEWRLAQAFGIWGLLWWTRGLGAEIDQFVAQDWEAAVWVAAAGASAITLEAVAAWRTWRIGRWLALSVIPALAWLVLRTLDDQPHLLAHGGWLAWPFALGSVYWVLARLEVRGPEWLDRAYAPAFWLLVGATGLSLGGFVASSAAMTDDWAMAAAGAGMAGVLLAAVYGLERGRAPFGRHLETQLTLGMAPVATLGLVWIGVYNLVSRGDAAPLPHVPILNPVDVSMAVMAVALLGWWTTLRRHLGAWVTSERRQLAIVAAAGGAFLWLNGILVRAVHQWTHVRFRADDLWHSVALQSSLSISWTVIALAGMLLSTRHAWRQPWMVFASLLGVVVVKLFVVDLSQLSTVAKIGTFLVVGALLLVVGYLSPVPPSTETERSDALEAKGNA
ncbi:MAG: DUF2339 domain-containing protein [Deltaproteobacteria bacterium]|nr:DUF2339 domain-containing protein [Deltaproteobacteria bacterium]